jgi:prepilin-type N-terminal cleavage/methylation domain-containing protein/prepilin-type processing-associated H-X9-DG protein
MTREAPPLPSPCRPGFTLVELLVVMAVVAILAGMLLPVVNLVRTAAQVATCGSAQRQIAASIQMYAMDQDGLMPRVRLDSTPLFWPVAVAPYVDGFVGNPAAPTYFDINPRSVFWGCQPWRKHQAAVAGFVMTGYGLNNHPDRPVSNAMASVTDFSYQRINQQSTRVMAGDSSYYPLQAKVAAPVAFLAATYPILLTLGVPYNDADPERHGRKGANYVFYDGHVQMLAPAAALAGLTNP